MPLTLCLGHAVSLAFAVALDAANPLAESGRRL